MDKYLVFTFPDGSMYRLPAEVVSRHFCKQHQVDSCSDTDLVAHWQTMPFAEVKDDLVKISSMPGLKPSQFLSEATAQILTTKEIENLLTEEEVGHE